MGDGAFIELLYDSALARHTELSLLFNILTAGQADDSRLHEFSARQLRANHVPSSLTARQAASALHEDIPLTEATTVNKHLDLATASLERLRLLHRFGHGVVIPDTKAQQTPEKTATLLEEDLQASARLFESNIKASRLCYPEVAGPVNVSNIERRRSSLSTDFDKLQRVVQNPHSTQAERLAALSQFPTTTLNPRSAFAANTTRMAAHHCHIAGQTLSVAATWVVLLFLARRSDGPQLGAAQPYLGEVREAVYAERLPEARALFTKSADHLGIGTFSRTPPAGARQFIEQGKAYVI